MSANAATAAAPESSSLDELTPVYTWQIPVRVAHWLIALSIVVQSATGIYLGRPFLTVPGAAVDSFIMGWVKVVHGYTAYVFIAALLMRLIWMFTGDHHSHWDKFIPVHRARLRGMWPVTSFYLFLRDKPPSYVGHNPVAAGAYTLVYGLCLVMVLTGLIMRGASTETSVIAFFGSWAELFGGLPTVRWIHHIVMWLLLGFAVHHVYSAVLVAMVEKNGTIDSIISGYKWVPKRDLAPGPYRWNNRGDVDE